MLEKILNNMQNKELIDLTLFPKVYEKYKDIDKGEIVLVKGEVQRRFDKYQIIVNEIKRIND